MTMSEQIKNENEVLETAAPAEAETKPKKGKKHLSRFGIAVISVAALCIAALGAVTVGYHLGRAGTGPETMIFEVEDPEEPPYIDPFVVFDTNGIKMEALSIQNADENGNDIGLLATVTNNTESPVTVSFEDVLVNGVFSDDVERSATLEAGETKDLNILISYSDFYFDYAEDKIKTIQFTADVVNNETGEAISIDSEKAHNPITIVTTGDITEKIG